MQGTVSNLNGDNSQIQVLFPTTEYALRLVESADGNRNSRLTLRLIPSMKTETCQQFFVARDLSWPWRSFSEDTIELRFNTAADSVASNFPARRLTQDNVGFLPLDSALSLR